MVTYQRSFLFNIMSPLKPMLPIRLPFGPPCFAALFQTWVAEQRGTPVSGVLQLDLSGTNVFTLGLLDEHVHDAARRKRGVAGEILGRFGSRRGAEPVERLTAALELEVDDTVGVHTHQIRRDHDRVRQLLSGHRFGLLLERHRVEALADRSSSRRGEGRGGRPLVSVVIGRRLSSVQCSLEPWRGGATAATSFLPASITSTATATPTSRNAPQPIAANSGALDLAIGAAGGVGANGAGDGAAPVGGA